MILYHTEHGLLSVILKTFFEDCEEKKKSIWIIDTALSLADKTYQNYV